MTVDLLVLIALAVGLVCGWLARWQWERRDPDDEWGEVYDRWDRS